MEKLRQGKIIYSKRIKEILEDQYNIYPVYLVDNPKSRQYHAWVFEKTAQLYSAIAEIEQMK